MMQALLRLPVGLVTGLCIAVVLVVTLRLMLPMVGSRAPQAVRDVRVEEQTWRKRVRRLQHRQDAASHLPGGRTLDELRLTLLETLERATEQDNLLVEDVSIEQASLVEPVLEPTADADDSRGDETATSGVTTLRLRLDGELPHAGRLIGVFERLSLEVATFPAEVRGCSVKRAGVDRGIRVSCLYDIYHWDDPLMDDTASLSP